MATKTDPASLKSELNQVMQHAEFDSIRIGDSASREFEVTERHVSLFAELSLDNNALHMDEEYARERGFEGRVAHGMIAMSAISQLIGTQLPGHGSLWVSQQNQFAEPVLIGDVLVASVEVERISRATEAVVLKTEVINRDTGRPVLRGKAGVRVPHRSGA